MIRRAIIIIFLCSMCINGCKTEEELYIETGCIKLTKTEVSKLYNGNSMTGVLVPHKTNIGFKIYFHTAGRMSGEFFNQERKVSDTGSYSIMDDGSLYYVWDHLYLDFNRVDLRIYRCADHYKIFNSPGGELLTVQRMSVGKLKELSSPQNTNCRLRSDEPKR